MSKHIDPIPQGARDRTTASIVAAAFGLSGLTLIPALLLLSVLAAVSFIGVRFVWGLVQLL